MRALEVDNGRAARRFPTKRIERRGRAVIKSMCIASTRFGDLNPIWCSRFWNECTAYYAHEVSRLPLADSGV